MSCYDRRNTRFGVAVNDREPGYLLLHRRIWESEVGSCPELLWVFLRLLSLVRHTDTQVYVKGKRYHVRRGQYLTCWRRLPAELKLSLNSARKYVRLLETLPSGAAVKVQQHPCGTLITVIKYNDYQPTVSNSDTRRDTGGGIGVKTRVRNTMTIFKNAHEMQPDDANPVSKIDTPIDTLIDTQSDTKRMNGNEDTEADACAPTHTLTRVEAIEGAASEPLTLEQPSHSKPSRTRSKNRLAKPRIATWDASDPLALVFERINRQSDWRAVFDAPVDTNHFKEWMSQYKLTIADLEDMALKFATYYADQKLKRPRAAFVGWCSREQTYRAQRQQQNGGKPGKGSKRMDGMMRTDIPDDAGYFDGLEI